MGVLETLGIRDAPFQEHSPLGDRLVAVNDPIKNSTFLYLHNGVTTCKYTALSLIPRFLYEQICTKYANLFFLFISCIQLIPNVSPTSKFGTALPLTVILLFSLIKELLEDRKRRNQDQIINNRICKKLDGLNFIEVAWQDIKVGDLVRIENSQYFPADLVLLSSSEPDAICYIETSNLDGETNLKIRQGIPETAGFLTPDSLFSLTASIRSELPNNRLYNFDATMTLASKEYPLSPEQLLLRGAQLRNTIWIYAVVVFTGHESKLMMNSTTTPIKRTKVERMVNSQIIFLLVILIFMSFVCALGFFVRQTTYSFEINILQYQEDSLKLFVRNLGVLLFN